MKMYGELEVYIHSFLTSALGEGVWSASRPACFTPEGRDPVTHWIGGWAGPRPGLDTAAKKRKIPARVTKFITEFTKAPQWMLFWKRSIQSSTFSLKSSWPILMLYSSLRSCVLSCLFSWGCPTIFLYLFSHFPTSHLFQFSWFIRRNVRRI